MGFTSGTGGSTDIHEVQNVELSSVVLESLEKLQRRQHLADHDELEQQSAAVPRAAPTSSSTNTFVNTCADHQRRRQQDHPQSPARRAFAYTLTGGSLELNGWRPSPSGICRFADCTAPDAHHQLEHHDSDNAVQIQNNSTGNLAIGGTVGLGSQYRLGQRSGNTTLSGVVSGAGSIVQSGTAP